MQLTLAFFLVKNQPVLW